MNKIEKFIRKLSEEQREYILFILERIRKGDLSNFDVKKLRGRDQEYRVRKGNIRIMFKRTETGFDVTDIQWRGSKTYH